MRLPQSPPALLALAFSLTPLASANPYPRDDLADYGYGYLMNRACAAYCGADNQYCCSKGQACTTQGGIASCVNGGGDYAFQTTTWTETRTYTSTMSTHLPTPTPTGAAGEACVPPEGSGQKACGPICCASWQWCANEAKGQCSADPDATSVSQWVTTGVMTTAFAAPYRVTSGSTIYETTPTGDVDSATVTPTGTESPEPVGTAGNLSGGAVAGIVIGTIAGVALLLLCCFCCVARGLWHTFLALFGLGHKKKERVEVIDEKYSRHSNSHAGRPSHGGWFGGGGRPSAASSRKEKDKKKLGWLAAGAGAAAVLLGLKRHEKHKAHSHTHSQSYTQSNRPPRSDWSSSYYTDSYTGTTPSSQSSGGRTRDTRRSRQTRTTRASRSSRH